MSHCCLNVSDGKMQTELLLVERNYAIKAICLRVNNQHPFKILQLVFISWQILKKCSSATKLKHDQFIFSEGTKVPATPQLTEANVSAQCEKPYLELLGGEGKRERHRVRQRETRRRD